MSSIDRLSNSPSRLRGSLRFENSRTANGLVNSAGMGKSDTKINW